MAEFSALNESLSLILSNFVSLVSCVSCRKGFYVDEDNGIGVTESVLKQTSPLRLNSHLLLIEALMEAFVKTCITIEASVKAVKETGAKFR